MNRPKKSLGQNFLIDQNIIRKILRLKRIYKKNVVEIGPGRGAITDKIIEEKPNSLILIEKDKTLLDKLKKKYKKEKFIEYLNEDILKVDIEKKIKKNTIIFGNLPYNISSQILVKFLKFKKWPPNFEDLILMFQKEVAEKITGKSYGRLSIIANYRLKILNKFHISANCFFPKPKVNSSILHFSPIINSNIKIKNIDNLENITNIFFSSKRKMIKKNLHKMFNENQIKKFNNLNQNDRPSDLEKEFFYKAVEILEND